MVRELYLNNFHNVNHQFSQGDYPLFSSPPVPLHSLSCLVPCPPRGCPKGPSPEELIWTILSLGPPVGGRVTQDAHTPIAHT